jgi:hypothetical protein
LDDNLQTVYEGKTEAQAEVAKKLTDYFVKLDLYVNIAQGTGIDEEGNKLYAEGAEDGTPVSIYNLQGVRVGQTTVEGGAIVLDGLTQGVYAVQLGKLGSTLIRL